MMAANEIKPDRRVLRPVGIAGLVLALSAGMVLGALLYWRLGGRTVTPDVPGMASPDSEAPAREEVPSSEVRISVEAQQEVGVFVEQAAFRSLRRSLSATGIVSEDPSRVAHIRPLARGLIEKIYARLGDRVSAGAPLIEYDNIELGVALGEYLSAQSELRRSLTDLEVRKKILDRSREMLRAGAVAQTTHDLREAEVRGAEARVAGARADVDKIEEQIHRFGWTDSDLAELRSAQPSSEHPATHTILRAPFGGVVTSHHAVESEIVEPGTELLAVTDLSSLWVLADVFERDLAHIRRGKLVEVRVAAYPGEVFHGQITYVSDVIDPKTRTAKARCLIRNNRGLLKLEMFATVEIPLELTMPSLAVPDSSIQQIDGKSVVFVRISETEFRTREVQTGVESEGYTEIRSGLRAGEAVASRGSFVIKTEFLKKLIGEKE